MAQVRVATGAAAAISAPTFVEDDGYTPAILDEAPTVAVTRDDGTEIDIPDPTESGDTYRTILPADQLEQPGRMTAAWTANLDSIDQVQTQDIDIVGRWYVPLVDLWQLPGLSDPSKYSPELLADLEAEFEDIAERYTGHAWVKRFASETHTVTGYCDDGRVILGHTHPRAILSAADDLSTEIDASTWVLTDTGLIWGAWLGRTTTIRYLHGHDAPPGDLVAACKDYVRSKAFERSNANRIGRDVLSSSDGTTGANIRYSTPDWAAGRPTGYLDIDRVLNARGGPVPGIA